MSDVLLSLEFSGFMWIPKWVSWLCVWGSWSVGFCKVIKGIYNTWIMLWYVVRLHQVSYVTTDFIGGLSIFWSNHTKTNSLNREGYFVLYILMALWALSLLTSTIWRKQPSIGLFWWRKSIPSNFRRCVWFEIELIWWFKSRTLYLLITSWSFPRELFSERFEEFD